MHFHLEFPITPLQNKITYPEKLIFIGSCFSENVAEKMVQLKFDVNVNPNGILYDPVSIASALKRYLNHTPLAEKDLFLANDLWNSFEHHSRFSHPDKNICLININDSIAKAHHQLKGAKWLFITFGSAFSYSLKEGSIPVANCHKIPQKQFDKTLLQTERIVSEYRSLFSELKRINPELNIVFTVSPVRYVRDGAVENNLSKSILIQSVHRLVSEFNNAFYFPAYELVIDDLRDYRFFKEDLVHPNEQAVDYVFEKFIQVSFDKDTIALSEKIKEISNALAHRPFNENSEGHKKFKVVYAERCKQLQTEFPFLDFNNELNHFQL